MSNANQSAKDNQHGAGSPGDLSSQAAANLARGQIAAAHDQAEPSASLIEQFWHHHQDHPDPSRAWHDFYQKLSDVDKYRLWQEYQAAGDQAHIYSDPVGGVGVMEVESTKTKSPKTVAQLKKQLLDKVPTHRVKKAKRHLQPIATAAFAGFLMLGINYNDLMVARVKQYVSPGDTIKSPVIIDPSNAIAVGPEPKVIIPKINVDVPVVYDVNTFSEKAIQGGLERGVVHYYQTGLPGQPGNTVIVGHSSNNFFNGGKYKFAFVLLNRLELGDTFMLHYGGTRYIYRVSNKQVVSPKDFSLIQPTAKPTATLITCDPPGTSWKRLIIQGEQISPKPSAEPAEITKQVTPDSDIVPGNSPSLFQRFKNWIF